jgi:hypothetical protein
VALKYTKKGGDTQILKGRCSCKEEYDVHATYISTLPLSWRRMQQIFGGKYIVQNV